MAQKISEVVSLLTTSEEMAGYATEEEEDSTVTAWGCRLAKAMIERKASIKEEVKKQSMMRANLSRVIREMEEKEEKVDASMRSNLKNIEA